MNMKRTKQSLSVGALGLAALLSLAARPGFAQAQRQQIGSVSARALRSTVTLGQARTEFELSGGVSIQTDTGDILRADRVVLVAGPMADPARPGQMKTDVLTATAAGDVSFKRVETVGAGAQAGKRVVTGTADRGELDRVNNKIALLRNVTVRSEDPTATYNLQNVAAAAIQLSTSNITADAPASQQMKMAVRQRVVPASGPAYWRTINGAARHAEVNRAANTALLTGNVNIAADEPTAAYSWANAARATINFQTQQVQAEAANGQQISVDVRFKTPPAAPKAKP